MESWRFGRAAGSYCERDDAVRPRAVNPSGRRWPVSERAERCDPNDGDLAPARDALDGGRPGVSLDCFRLGLWSDHRFGALLDTCTVEPSLSSAGVVIPVPVLLVATPSAK